MPSSKTGLATKRELNRYKKAELIKYIKEEGLPCNTKMSKRELVQCAFKHKGLRKKLSDTIPPKRKMSEKQKANLNKFRLGGKHQKDYKNEKTIKTDAKYLADLGKLEDKHVQGTKGTDAFIGTGKASHVAELKEANRVQAKNQKVRVEEHQESTTKTSDAVDESIKDKTQRDNKLRLLGAKNQAQHRHDKRFGEMDDPNATDISAFLTPVLDANGKPVMDANGNPKMEIDPSKVKNLERDVLAGKSTSRQAQAYSILSMLMKRKKERGTQVGTGPEEKKEPGAGTGTGTGTGTGASASQPSRDTGVSSGRSEGRETQKVERIAGDIISDVKTFFIDYKRGEKKFVTKALERVNNENFLQENPQFRRFDNQQKMWQEVWKSIASSQGVEEIEEKKEEMEEKIDLSDVTSEDLAELERVAPSIDVSDVTSEDLAELERLASSIPQGIISGDRFDRRRIPRGIVSGDSFDRPVIPGGRRRKKGKNQKRIDILN